MYKILLVDDERIILDGIANFIDWKAIGTNLIGTAKNGLEAWQMIEELAPDIVITDINMPGMNGLELVAKVHQTYPNIRFIMLSGFGEFDYAKEAMQYGVKHYILKPCNENDIIHALEDHMKELEQKNSEAQFVCDMKEQLENVLPYAREQLLKEFVTSNTLGLDYYEKIIQLDIDDSMIKLILFHIDGTFDYEHMFAIKNIAETIIPNPFLSCTVGEHILMIIRVNETNEESELTEKIMTVKSTFYQYYQMDLTIALSESGKMADARKLYRETLECLQHRFYLGEGSLITKKDITVNQEEELVYNEQSFCLLVKAGRWEDARAELEKFFQQLRESRFGIQTTKTYVIQLYNAMIRACASEQMEDYLSQLPKLLEMDTIQSMQQFFETIAREITVSFYQQNMNKHSAIIQQVLELIEEEIANKDISLNFIASEKLFISPDYLGKLFKKEIGEKFSQYLTRVKMEKAMQQIEQESDSKVFEIAEKLGYSDAQYFSQVFKRYTGFTPTEYKKQLTSQYFRKERPL